MKHRTVANLPLEGGAAPKLADLLLTLIAPLKAPADAGGAAPAPAPATLRTDIGAAVLAAKTLCNLCCACEVRARAALR